MVAMAVTYDIEAVKQHLTPTMRGHLRDYALLLRGVAEPWTAGALESMTREFSARSAIDFREFCKALRVAVTGSMIGVGMFDTLEILEQETTLRRIDKGVNHP